MIDLKDGRYFAAMWFIFHGEKTQDWHGALYRDEDDGPWVFQYRFRYYVDDKAHDSDDIKSWYTASFPANKTESEALEAVSMLADMVSREYGGVPVHKIILRTKKAEDVMTALAREKFISIKAES